MRKQGTVFVVMALLSFLPSDSGRNNARFAVTFALTQSFLKVVIARITFKSHENEVIFLNGRCFVSVGSAVILGDYH